MLFMVKASTQGMIVSKPYGDNQRYDFILDAAGRLLRLQVKGVFSACRGEFRRGYPISASRHRRSGLATYKASEIDFLAGFVAPHNAWYIVPVQAIAGRKSIRFYPAGRAYADAGLYEHYREAWHLLTSANPPDPRFRTTSCGTDTPLGKRKPGSSRRL